MSEDQPMRTQTARNNAEWCDAVCGVHGLSTEFSRAAWTCPQRTPRYYPDAVTLTASTVSDDVLARIDVCAGCSVKDSFACLDLTEAGFGVLLEAEWIYRSPRPPETAPTVSWTPVRDAAGLLKWAAAWGSEDDELGPFRPELLTYGRVVFLSSNVGGRISAGCIAYRSETVIGVSNLFSRDGDLDAAWFGALTTLVRWFPSLPIVGYEHGDALGAATRQGFVPIGGLRIWYRNR